MKSNRRPDYIFKFDTLPPSLNGGRRRSKKTGKLLSQGGLLRMHWAVRKQVQDDWDLLVKEQKTNRFGNNIALITRCRIVWRIRNTTLLDWDNACAAFKVLGDALVHAEVLKDDNPKVVLSFTPEQVKVKSKEEVGCEVEIYIVRETEDETTDAE